MALRGRLADKDAKFADPMLGVNLAAAQEDLAEGEAALMSNCWFWNGIRTREGSSRFNNSSLGAYAILGGHKYYYGGTNSKRLIVYNTNIDILSDGGANTNLYSTLTAGKEAQFCTWSVTDKVYFTNGTDKLLEYDGTNPVASTDSLVGATNVPNGCKKIVPVLDRLLAIASTGFIERTSPRVAHQWSSGSSWATFRPSLVGPFIGLHPHTLRSNQGDLFPGAIACQANAMYMITGTNFGSDATAGSASAGEDSAIKLIDSRIGTSSPNSMCTVPGVGVFGVSSDLNVWFLPFGAASPRIIGDKIRSTSSTQGLESANTAQISKIWMIYYDRKLILGFPTGSDSFCSRYFWLDIRSFVEHPDWGPVWNGPHYGFYTNHVWSEDQNGEKLLAAGEGNAGNGAFVYKLLQTGVFTDAVGTSDNNITFDYQSYFKDFGASSTEKYVHSLQMDMNIYLGTPTVSLYDLNGSLATNLPIARVI